MSRSRAVGRQTGSGGGPEVGAGRAGSAAVRSGAGAAVSMGRERGTREDNALRGSKTDRPALR